MLPQPSSPHLPARVMPVDFNTVDPVQLARALAHESDIASLPLCLQIDCQNLRCLRTQGVSYFVSQLLVLRGTGAGIRLLNVNPLLRRLLTLLRVDGLVGVELLGQTEHQPRPRATG